MGSPSRGKGAENMFTGKRTYVANASMTHPPYDRGRGRVCNKCLPSKANIFLKMVELLLPQCKQLLPGTYDTYHGDFFTAVYLLYIRSRTTAIATWKKKSWPGITRKKHSSKSWFGRYSSSTSKYAPAPHVKSSENNKASTLLRWHVLV